ncbi:glycosyltransferase family 2 protein [Flavobacterium rhizosphaerae]|uniref:Glycosyltransferase family A protein n=1 Tax=Flavobacterium rhizosphaerae TaxID=3163298 RepID=A0ABW8YZY5_9FLAO
MPIFSIVIPLYNKEKEIRQTLSSVFAQTFNDFEVIVINDGSTDESEKQTLSFKDQRLKYFVTENRGISAARNLGIEKASASLISFLDADDYWYPNHLETLYALHRNYPQAGIVASNYEFLLPDNTVKKTIFKNIPNGFSGIVENVFAISMNDRALWTTAVVVKKEVFEAVGNFDNSITLGAGEDTDMWIRIALKYPVAYTKKVTTQYRLGAQNRVSHSQTLNRKFSRLDKFKAEEAYNKPLKKYLDMYRASYAFKHKLAGDHKTFRFYYTAIDTKNLSAKTRMLLWQPAFVLRLLHYLKTHLRYKKVYIDIYN